MNNSAFSEIVDAISTARRIAIVTHVGPDGDAAGSSLALMLLLRNLGKDAKAYIRRADLGAPSVMEGCELFSDPDDFDMSSDLVIALDCATVKRISTPLFAENIASFKVVNIDHHETNPGYGALNYIVAGGSSTGEIIWELAVSQNWELTRPIAEALWTAIVTDTGRFSYSSTSSRTFLCAADLKERGKIRQDYLNDEIFCRVDKKVLQLRARALSTLELWDDGRVAVIKLDADDYAEFDCKKSDTEDFVDIPRSVRGIKMAIFFYRSSGDDDSIKLSIRSYEPVSASDFAAQFGGGGHRLAAGATIKGSMDEVVAKVKAIVKNLSPAEEQRHRGF